MVWAALALLTVMGDAARAQSLTEDDYLAELPVVLTASRLQQSLHDAPGSMTVIDRDQIRRTGARDVAELLRLVPGYMVGGFNGAHPVASYHAPLDEYGMRNLVLIDGRSAYSSFFLGDTHRGMMSVLPEDIERVEVLRGANSAAYGANAMFGVINIITRHTADSLGAEAQVSVGSADLRDARVSLGFGDEKASHRLSFGQREDSGYAVAFDDRRLRVLDWRTDLRPAADQDLMLRAGASDLQSGRGYGDTPGDPERTVQWREWFLQGRWQRQLEGEGQLQLSADFTQEDYADVSHHLAYKKVLLDYGSRGQRANLELQHTLVPRPDLRAVWGLGWKQEQAQSRPLFYTDESVEYRESRLFGHLEWRPTERWTANAGAFLGDHSHSGTYVAPRLMLNHHFTPDHTLRFGINRSMRTNSLLEFAGDIRYDLSPYKLGQLRYWSGNPDIRPERLDSREVSYLGQFRPLHLTVDVRAYNERLKDGISYSEAYSTAQRVFDNLLDLTVRGVEYQLSWEPRHGTRLQWQQSFSELEWADPVKNDTANHKPPGRASTLAWSQQLPSGYDLMLMRHERGEMTWDRDERDHDRLLPAASRIDLRLAKHWRIGSKKAEAALTVQALDGDHLDTRQSFQFQRRAFLTLRLEQ
ncbi:TonB-dependent siderophore receptor [Malikia sp.]|uniref:TonB-dependent receptor plug domain-containing protein n=1 Tax=Malikia sp. TaxID=2070706 RepID=UPI00261C0696|nr:TonB-dependent receptor [Malikia sp.]MDD2728139.1 TonB-dependent receptor [Malikia sp.]